MSSDVFPNLGAEFPDTVAAEPLSVALIGPDPERRSTMAQALAESRRTNVREFHSYPPELDDVQRLLEQSFDVIVLDLDSDPDLALELVSRVSASDSATIMVYSEKVDQKLAVRCMRAGAREYLLLPLEQGVVSAALAATDLHPKARPAKKVEGDLLVFLSAKGGTGVTTVACNLAIALAQESNRSTLLIDFALPIGDVALNLGIASDYSTEDALKNTDRLDTRFLQKLLVKHKSGVIVLAAPSQVPEATASKEAIDKLIAVARREFDHVIVDVGSRTDMAGTALFKEASTLYLVTQTGISELRNSSRVLSQFFTEGSPNLEIVLNRFEPRSEGGVNEDAITKALGRPVRWKIPDDQDAARKLQVGDVANADTSISRLSREMACSITERQTTPERKKVVLHRGRNVAEEFSVKEGRPHLSIVPPAHGRALSPITWQAPEPIVYGDVLTKAQLNAETSIAGTLIYTPGPGYVLPAGTHTLWVTLTPAESDGRPPLQASVSIAVSTATPLIFWKSPAAMTYGTALSEAELNASTSISGKFDYSPALGEVLEPGTHTLSVTFTPKDRANYELARAIVSITVAKPSPEIEWPTPEAITCGTALGDAQLNAKASVPGTFDYSPAAGEVLSQGTHRITATFTPADSTTYATSQASVSLNVSKATPVIEWANPEPITYGTLLGATQLCASASVPGTFEYNPGFDALLAAGEHSPSVIFTPEDGSDYAASRTTVKLSVLKVTPEVTWPEPDAIVSGTPLGAAQLNATAITGGAFAYAPAVGQVLAPGVHELSAIFTPADTMNYNIASVTVSFTVTEPQPMEITWPVPDAVPYGTALSDSQLNATASAPGTFVYAPAAGHVLAPGKHTLSVMFTPSNIAEFATAQATVSLVVEGLPEFTSLSNATTHFSEFIADSTFADLAPAEVRSKHDSAERRPPRETRSYKGAVYEKGADGQWHLQQK